jgi:hypothetical protein
VTTVKSTRRSRKLRSFFEGVVLVSSLVAGTAIVGACVSGSTGLEQGVLGLVGLVFALVLVGAVFLFTTMSRDLRLLRERLTANGEPRVQDEESSDRG